MFKLFGLTFLALLSGACTSSYRLAELGVISPDITGIDPVQLQKAKIIQDVTGTDTSPVFFIFPQGYPNLEYAARRALQSSEADILVNVQAEYKSSWYLFGGQNSITVTADAVRLAPLFSAPEENAEAAHDRE